MTGPLTDLGPWIADISCRVLGEPNRLLSTRQQLRFGSNGSVAVEIDGAKRGQWFDHEAGVGGGPWELLTIKGRMTNGPRAGGCNRNLGSRSSLPPIPRAIWSPPMTTATNPATCCPRFAGLSPKTSNSGARTVRGLDLPWRCPPRCVPGSASVRTLRTRRASGRALYQPT
jgi:hypothetical protein